MRSAVSQSVKSLSSITSCQKRWKPFKALKWQNDRTMRDGLKQVNKPWELRNDCDFVKGHFGLVTKRGGHLTEKQFENAVLYIKQHYRTKDYKITVNDEHQIHPLSRRPQGSKLGKGLGDHLHWVLRVRPGTVILDIETRFPEIMDDHRITKFFKGIKPLFGVETFWQRKGMVNGIDDIDYASSQPFIDRNVSRRLQDAYPGEAYKMHYYSFAENEKESQVWNPRKQSRQNYPVFQGRKFPHLRARFMGSRFER